jgi:hypothetical protein
MQKVNATSVKVGWNMFQQGITNYAHSDGWNPAINLVVLK